MAEISIGAAVGEGFDLIRRKPLTVVAWGFCQTALFGLAFALMGSLLVPGFVEMARQSQAGTPPSPQAMQALMQGQSVIYLLDLVNFLVGAVYYCAVMRAVIHPEQGRFAYLRIGTAELLLALLILVAAFAFGAGLFVAILAVGIIIGILVLMHAGIVGGILGVLGFFAAIGITIYLALRVSMVAPMLVDEGKLELGEAWKLTKGKVAGLLGIALVIFLILIAIELVLGIVLLAVGLGVLGSLAGGLSNLPVFLQQPPQQWVGRLVPLLAIFGLIWIPISGGIMAITGAPWARAYLDLRPQRDIAQTFA